MSADLLHSQCKRLYWSRLWTKGDTNADGAQGKAVRSGAIKDATQSFKVTALHWQPCGQMASWCEYQGLTARRCSQQRHGRSFFVRQVGVCSHSAPPAAKAGVDSAVQLTPRACRWCSCNEHLGKAAASSISLHYMHNMHSTHCREVSRWRWSIYLSIYACLC